MATEVLRTIALAHEIHLRPKPSLSPSLMNRSPPVSPKAKERPLPAPPVSTDDFRTASSVPSMSSKRWSKLSQAASSRFRPNAPLASRQALSRVLKQPRTLAHLLEASSWGDIHALISTCREFRQDLFRSAQCREVILSFYVPGYSLALQSADVQHVREVAVAVDFHELTLLIQSQFVPLHKYPMLSLSVLNRFSQHANYNELHEATARYVALTQAHSRFVLFLQALVHSAPPTPITDDVDNNILPSDNRVPQFAGVRKLVFPAPLAYCDAGDHTGPTEALSGSGCDKLTPRALSQSPTRASGDFHALLGQGSRTMRQPKVQRRSLFRGPKVPVPPPAESIASQYVNGWARSSYQVRKSPPQAWNQQQRRTRVTSVSDDDFKKPQRRFTSGTFSSDSSLVSPLSTRSQTEPSGSGESTFSPRASSQPPPPAVAVPRGTSPHDLYLATSRVRAPVLRTFVPCAVLDENAIAACEDQLVNAGLWEHLSTGDIVCNFGYVPLVTDDRNVGGEPKQEWLLFDGTGLALYSPPAPPPLEDALSLPSPFYYAHILPPWSNPYHVLSLPALPRVARSDSSSHVGRKLGDGDVQLTLTHVPARVRSPHSPRGFALVRKFAWIARLPYVGAGSDGSAGVGHGWQGEWMLEGEGTREGRQSLLDALSDGLDGSGLTRRGKWEVVRDKSGNGRLWMKLLIPNVDESNGSQGPCDAAPSSAAD